MSADRISMMSGASQMRSVAPSMMNNDFNGKKYKIIQTCREIDDMKSGVIKTNIFHNLLSMLEVEVQHEDLAECQRVHGIVFEGNRYVKYEPVIRLLSYDNHSETWTIRKTRDDMDGLSLAAEGKAGRRGLKSLNRLNMRASYDTLPSKLRMFPMRQSMNNNESSTILSTDALKHFEKRRDTAKRAEDEESQEV